MLSIPLLVEMPTVSVGIAEDKLDGWTFSQGLAWRRIGEHDFWYCTGPRN
jgi:hypothetical protein